MMHEVADETRGGRSVAGLILGLEREGWSLAEDVIFLEDGQLAWIVAGRNGPRSIRSRGSSMADAWAGAAEQARSSPAGGASPPARPDPSPRPRAVPPAPGRTTASAGGRTHRDSLDLGDFAAADYDLGERDGAARRPGQPGRRGRRRPDGKADRDRTHARRTNPNRC